MLRSAAVFACALALFLGGCAAPERLTAVDSAGIRQQVESILELQQAAWNRGDLQTFLSTGYWQSNSLTFLSGGSWSTGYSSVSARYQKRYQEDGREMGHLTFRDLETLPLANRNALVRGRWHLRFTDGKQTGGLFTLLLKRFPEGWRIVHDHTSVGD